MAKARILLEDEQRRRYAVTETCRMEPLFTDEELAQCLRRFLPLKIRVCCCTCGSREEEMQLPQKILAWYQQGSAHRAHFPVLTGKQCVRNCWNTILPIRMRRETEAACRAGGQRLRKGGPYFYDRALVRHGCYSRAFALTDRYGYEKIPVSCLFRLAHAMILEKSLQRTRSSLSGILRGKTGHLR